MDQKQKVLKMASTKVKQRIFKVPVYIYRFLPSIGRPLQGRQRWDFFSEGRNKTEARLELTKFDAFWKKYNALSKEERKKIEHPFRLRREGKIEEVLFCKRRHKNKYLEYTCGRPIGTDNQGEFGMCVLQGFDPPGFEDCYYNNEDDRYSKLLQTKKHNQYFVVEEIDKEKGMRISVLDPKTGEIINESRIPNKKAI